MKILITKQEQGIRLDKYLSSLFPDLSRSLIQKNIINQPIYVNAKSVKPAYLLKVGDSLNLKPMVEELVSSPKPQKKNLDIVYEENDFLVVNKPKGLVVHPAHANPDHTLVNYLLDLRPEIRGAVYDPKMQISRLRPGIVHRLDKDTTGLVIVAKNKNAMQTFSKIIHEHQITKTYIALVCGWPDATGEIETFLKRSTLDRRKMTCDDAEGKKAKTGYKVLNYYGGNTYQLALVEVQPVTGRTHQIRVHFASIGHPILGDQYYYNQTSRKISDKLNIQSQLLHAAKLNFLYQDRKLDLCAPLPLDFSKIINQLKEADE